MSQLPAQKVPVLIASTLKPIRDVRAFEKLAHSLGETTTYELNIIGFSPKKPKSEPGFRFFSSMSHTDSRVDRLFAQVRFFRCLLQVRPKILICCTYELLPIASFFKSVLRYKLVYDVQENYVANLELNHTLSYKQKATASQLIRKAEAVPGIDLFLLAEKCYADEMPDKRPFLFLENKFLGGINKTEPLNYEGKKKLRFCITGTITPAFGSCDAVGWFREVLKSYPESELEIVGHCPMDSFCVKLTHLAKDIPQLLLRIEHDPIPHEILIAAMRKADFVLMPYQNHPAIAGKIPTKLFECAALGMPVLISSNPLWEDFLADFQGGFSIDFTDVRAAKTQLDAALAQAYFISTPPENVLWTTETLHLQQAAQNLLA